MSGPLKKRRIREDGLSALESLQMSGTGVTDLSPLAGLARLRVLELADTAVSDLSPLEGLTALRRLDIRGTRAAGQAVTLAMKWCRTVSSATPRRGVRAP
jgi:hypothetical protein